MADFSKPVTTDTYTNVLTYLKATTSDLALGLDPATTTPTNVPTNAVRWSSASNKWQKYNGTAWVDLSSLYAISISGNAGTATTLATARSINGVSFNGSADITVKASTTNALTFSNSGGGAASGLTFDGGTARTISYDTVGAPSTTGTNASGTWSISVSGNAGTVTNGVYVTTDQSIGGTKTFTSGINAIGGLFIGGSASPVYVYESATGELGFRTGSLGAYKYTTFDASGYIAPSAGIKFSDATTLTSATQALVNSKTAVASTSGTAIDFTAIPAGVKRVTVMFSGVSTSGNSAIVAQLGTSGGFVTSGYAGSSTNQNGGGTSYGSTTVGLGVDSSGAGALSAAVTRVGKLELVNVSGNTWVSTSIIGYTNAANVEYSASSVTLTGTLERLRVTTVNGTDTFDAGSINILYE